MDSINDIISSLSDDDIEMLKGVANSILGDSNKENKSVANTNAITELASNSTSSLGLSADDFNMILKAKQVFEKMNSKSSKNADLIKALKPHLSPKYQDRADQAIKMLGLFEVMPYIKELF